MTQPGLATIVSMLNAARGQILDRWTAIVAESSRGRITTTELGAELAPIFDAIIAGLSDDQTTTSGAAYAEARALLAELSRSRARQGFSPSETAASMFAFKQAAREVADVESHADAARSFIALNGLLDELALFTFETYAEARDRIINQQAEEMLELSTPVVKLWDGVVAVPLVGTLDSARTQVVTEKLLQALVDTGSEHAIIDITGVPAVDTQVAQHLLKTVVAARLMGAECIISGIRPQIAQTIVALGIEFGDIATKATLADALSLALRQSGIAVNRGAR
jgi:rsbT co-antagonist protein RsbR